MQTYQILLVEDNAPLRQVLERSLLQNQYRVIAVASIAEAMVALQAEWVDLLLTDVSLDGNDEGFHLASWARALRPALPILLMSGIALFATPPELLADPAVRQRAKPFKISSLLAVLAELLAWRAGIPPRHADAGGRV